MLIIDSEKLPEEIISWLNKDKESKVKFLSSIGINNKNDEIVTLREWFMDGNAVESNKPQIDSINHELLSNTLVGLGDLWDDTFKFEINSEKHKLINHIIRHLVEDEENYKFRLPVYIDSLNLKVGNE